MDPNTNPAPVALVTGASRGLGLALAEALAVDGWQLVVTARTAPELDAAAERLRRHTTVVALAGSVVDDEHRARLAEAAGRLGGTALLVNNAATLTGYELAGRPLPTLAEFPLPGLLETFEVGVLAPIALTQLVLPQLRAHAGAVLNISSDAAVAAYPGWGGYGAAKAALDHASAVLAVEEPQLRVWAVDPGSMRTRMLQEAGEDLAAAQPPAAVVPAFRTLLRTRPASGRYTAAALARAVGEPA